MGWVLPKTALLVIATALAEILGCFLPYLWRRRNGPIWLLLPGTNCEYITECLCEKSLNEPRCIAILGGVEANLALNSDALKKKRRAG
jgi:drug/metabolite transporter superfamily protein YnfA